MGLSVKARTPAPSRDYGGAAAGGITGFIAGRLVLAVLAFARCAPQGFFYACTAATVKCLLFFAPHIKRHASRNLKEVLGYDISPRELRQLVNENIENTFARKWSDIFLLPRLTGEFLEHNVDFVGLEKYRDAVAEGRGVLLITHHVGSYGLLAGYVLPRLGNPVSAGARRIFDEKTEAALFSVYQSYGTEVANPGESLRMFLARLKSGGTVLVAGDHLTSPKGLKVSYFGRETLIPGGPATLACRYQPVTMPCYCVRTAPDRFLVEFGDPFSLPRQEKKVDEEQLQAFARQYIDYFEDVVRRYPTQWECFFDLWPDSFEKKDIEAFCRGYGVNV